MVSKVSGSFYFFNRSMDNAFFQNRVNSWLKDRKERTEFNIQIIGLFKAKNFLAI